MPKDKYTLIWGLGGYGSEDSHSRIQEYFDKLLKLRESKEYKLLLLQTDFDNLLKGKELIPHSKNNALKYINEKNIQYSVKHYLDICKEFKFKTFSDISENKCILDPAGYPLENISSIQIDVSEVNIKLLQKLSKHPEYLYQLSSRKFEEVIAEIMIQMGYCVELTPATRDGGKDIYVAHKNDLGSFLYLVECKKYNPTQKVGINVVRDLYGVVSAENATCGIIATTSYFTKQAQDFQQRIKFRMSLQDFDCIKQWLCDVT